MNELPKKYWAIVREDGRVVLRGSHVGVTLDYLTDMAKQLNGVVTFGDRPFVRNEVGNFFGYTWQQLMDKQMRRDPFASIVERIAGGAPTLDPQKVQRSVVHGYLQHDDLAKMAKILQTEGLSDEEMTKKIPEAVSYVTPEAASILVSAWLDGGRDKQPWRGSELEAFIRQRLITKLGSRRGKKAFIGNPAEFTKHLLRDIASAMSSFGRIVSEKVSGGDISLVVEGKDRQKVSLSITQDWSGSWFEAVTEDGRRFRKLFDWFFSPPEAYDGAMPLRWALNVVFGGLERQVLPVAASAKTAMSVQDLDWISRILGRTHLSDDEMVGQITRLRTVPVNKAWQIVQNWRREGGRMMDRLSMHDWIADNLGIVWASERVAREIIKISREIMQMR